MNFPKEKAGIRRSEPSRVDSIAVAQLSFDVDRFGNIVGRLFFGGLESFVDKIPVVVQIQVCISVEGKPGLGGSKRVRDFVFNGEAFTRRGANRLNGGLGIKP